MNVTDYMVQQTHQFNERADGIQQSIQELTDRLRLIEYNIERLEQAISILTDTLQLLLPNHQEGDDTTYEKYIQRT